MNEIENTLRNLLRNNIVSFTFRKVDGTIRHALGTRNLDLASRYTQTEIPTPRGEEQPTSYFDVEKMGWRSWKEGSVISVDGCKIGWRVAEPTKKGELPKREIPISKSVEDMPKHYTDDPIDLGFLGGDIAKAFGGMFGGFGLARPSKEEIRKSMDKLDKDIIIGNPPYGKVGTPTATERGIALPLGEIGVEDFAKMVAHYVVEELVSRIKQL